MKKFYLPYLLLFIFAVGFTNCTSTSRLASPQNVGDTRNAVLQADRNFSAMSAEKGMNTAFIAYAADSAVLLRPQSQPIVGRDNIRMYLSRTSDKDVRLTRSPMFADISASGDLAYTYGIYVIETVDMNGKVVTFEGTYATTWEKDPKGFWKYVLDTGNAGLRP